MKCFNRLVLSTTFTLMACGSAMAATTVVNSGANTLQGAIVAAADGDTLVLGAGSYTDSDSIIYVDKSLTIRSESAAVDPLIYAKISQQSGTSIDHLRFQGITFAYNNGNNALELLGALGTLEVLESTIQAGTPLFVNPTNTTTAVTFVGNRMSCNVSGGSSFIVYANKFNFMGNSFCTDSFYVYPEDTGAEVNLIGNSIAVTSSFYIPGATGDRVLVAGNRITRSFCGSSSAPCSLGASSTYELLHLGSTSYATVRNNILRFSDNNLSVVTTAKRFSPIADLQGYTIENNLIDASSIGIWQPSIGETEQEAMFEEATLQVPALFRGNIVVNYNDKVLPAGYSINPENNLCFNNSENGTATNCGTANGNLENDPLFVDTVDYRLGTTSPAIDAGTTDLMLSDLDTSRNDMGPYGGNWSIAKFDAQRDPAETRPYIYPVIDSAYTVGGGSVKVKYVSYGRQQ